MRGFCAAAIATLAGGLLGLLVGLLVVVGRSGLRRRRREANRRARDERRAENLVVLDQGRLIGLVPLEDLRRSVGDNLRYILGGLRFTMVIAVGGIGVGVSRVGGIHLGVLALAANAGLAWLVSLRRREA